MFTWNELDEKWCGMLSSLPKFVGSAKLYINFWLVKDAGHEGLDDHIKVRSQFKNYSNVLLLFLFDAANTVLLLL